MAPAPSNRNFSLPLYQPSAPSYYTNSPELGRWTPVQEGFDGRYYTQPTQPYPRPYTPPHSSDYSARVQQLQQQQQLQQLLLLQQQQFQQQQRRVYPPTPPTNSPPWSRTSTPSLSARSRISRVDEFMRQSTASKRRLSPSRAPRSVERLRYLVFDKQILEFLPMRGQAWQLVNECINKGASLQLLLHEARLGYEKAERKSDEENFYRIVMEDVERRIASEKRGDRM